MISGPVVTNNLLCNDRNNQRTALLINILKFNANHRHYQFFCWNFLKILKQNSANQNEKLTEEICGRYSWRLTLWQRSLVFFLYGLGAAFRKCLRGLESKMTHVPRVPFPTGPLTNPEFGPKEPPISSPKKTPKNKPISSTWQCTQSTEMWRN